MKLNKKSLIELRSRLANELLSVEEGTKIQLEKDLLEGLLFVKKYDEASNRHYKSLVWSGLFLQFLDLSEISFDDVDWSDKNVKLLENVNARIDFSKGYYSSSAMYQGKKVINNCRFDGTDLSNSNIEYVDMISSSSFKATNANMKDLFEKKIPMSSVELNGIDLAGQKIDLIDYPYVCFTDTKADLLLDPNNERFQYGHEKKVYGMNYGKDFYAGCTINGTRVFYKQQRINMASIRYSGYEAYERSVVNSTLGLIKRHKKGLN